MALKSHFLPLDKPKIRLWRGRGSDVSNGRQALVTHFLPLDQSKMRLGWIQESDDSRALMSLWTQFQSLEHPKCDLVDVEKALFQWLAWHFQLIFGLRTIPNCDLVEVKKVNFLVVARHCELFSSTCPAQNAIWVKSKSDDSSCRMSLWSLFCFLTNRKCDFFKSSKRRFKWSNGTYLYLYSLPLDQSKMRLEWSRESDVSRARISLWTHFRPLDHPKMGLVWSRESDVSRAYMTQLIFGLWTSQNCDFDEVKIRHF